MQDLTEQKSNIRSFQFSRLAWFLWKFFKVLLHIVVVIN